MPVKDASTKHTQNLMALDQSVKKYRNSIASYYDHLIAKQRQAYIAQKTGNNLHNIATTQSNSLKDLPQDASTDFITAGTIIADDFAFWGRNFDIWMNNFKGKSLAHKKRWLKKRVERLEQVKKDKASGVFQNKVNNLNKEINVLATSITDLQKQIEKDPGNSTNKNKLKVQKETHEKLKGVLEKLRQDELDIPKIAIYKGQLNRNNDGLTYIAVGADLKQQKVIIDAQLELLNVQVNVMQAFHRKVDEFLSIDATIDGAKIAEAAAAGAKLDLSGLPGLDRALKGGQ